MSDEKKGGSLNAGIVVLVVVCFIALFVGGFSLGWSLTGGKEKEIKEEKQSEVKQEETILNEEISEETSKSEEENKFAENVTYETKATWEGGDNKYYQYVFNFDNLSEEKISDWTMKITFSSDVVMDGNWNGIFEADKNAITITPVDYNKDVEAGSSVSDIGLTVYSEKEITITGIEFAN